MAFSYIQMLGYQRKWNKKKEKSTLYKEENTQSDNEKLYPNLEVSKDKKWQLKFMSLVSLFQCTVNNYYGWRNVILNHSAQYYQDSNIEATVR